MKKFKEFVREFANDSKRSGGGGDGPKQVIPPHGWHEKLFDDPKSTVHNRLPRGSVLTHELVSPQGTYRSGSVEGEIHRSPKGEHYYRETLTGDNDNVYSKVPKHHLDKLENSDNGD